MTKNHKLMLTNEKNRINADRNIPLTFSDKIYEILGNSNGNIQGVYCDENNLYVFNNDEGFSESDKKAYLVKNQSGDNQNTAGINGIGEALVIDRLLPEDKEALIFSFNPSKNEYKKLELGHFSYDEKGWQNMDNNDIIFSKI